MAKFMFFDFRCTACDNVTEGFVKPDVHEQPCPECGAVAKRTISAPHFDPKMGLDSDFGTFSDKWARTNKQKTKQDKEFYEKHGVDKMHHSYGS